VILLDAMIPTFCLTAYWIKWCSEWCDQRVEWFCCWWTTNEGSDFYKQSAPKTRDGRPRTVLQVWEIVIVWYYIFGIYVVIPVGFIIRDILAEV